MPLLNAVGERTEPSICAGPSTSAHQRSGCSLGFCASTFAPAPWRLGFRATGMIFGMTAPFTCLADGFNGSSARELGGPARR